MRGFGWLVKLGMYAGLTLAEFCVMAWVHDNVFIYTEVGVLFMLVIGRMMLHDFGMLLKVLSDYDKVFDGDDDGEKVSPMSIDTTVHSIRDGSSLGNTGHKDNVFTLYK